MNALISALFTMLAAWSLIAVGVGIFLVVMTALGWTAAFSALCGVTSIVCTVNVVR